MDADLKELKQLIVYNPENGAMTRTDRRARGISGSERRNVTMMVHGKVYSRSKIAWFLSYGEWPEWPKKVFHLDRDNLNFRLNNLTLEAPPRRRYADPTTVS
jgi:hypothetical protein